MVKTLFYIFFFILSSGYAQSGVIHVKNLLTEKTIQDVSFVFKPFNLKKEYFIFSDRNGTLINPVISKSIVEISYIGYKTIVDTIYPNTDRTFFLEEDVFNLNQITVTATHTKKLLKNTPVLTQIITAKQIQDRGLQTVQDVLDTTISGIEFNRVGFGTSISVQGLSATNILILIDGERMAGETASNIDYSRINTQDIERIEIIKGATSTLYGSQAMGAVINIITKKKKKPFYANIGWQYTTHYDLNYPNLSKDDINYSIAKQLDKTNFNQNYTLGFSKNRWRTKTLFTIKSSDAYQLYDQEGIVKNYTNIDTVLHQNKNLLPSNVNGFKDYTISQSLYYTVDKYLSFSGKVTYYEHEKFDFIFDNKHEKFNDLNYTLRAKYVQSENLSFTLTYHDDSYLKYDFLEQQDRSRLKYHHHLNNPKLLANYSIRKKHAVVGALEFLHESLQSKLFVQDELVTKDISSAIFFVQDDISFSNNWNIIMGLRTEYHSSFGFYLTSKASLMYKKYPVTFRANYASGYRSPNLKELYMDWDLLGMFTIKGNELLAPETNNYFAASLEYSHAKINTSISIYKNFFKNKIEGLWFDNQTIYQYHNTESSQLFGVDFNVSYHPFSSLFIKAGYSFVKEDRKKGIRITAITPHSASLQIGYLLHFNNFKIHTNLSGKYIGVKDFIASENIEFQGEIVEAIYPIHYDAYSIWRFSVSHNYKNYGSLTMGINNILNYHAPLITFDTYTNPGRNFFVGLQLELESIINNKTNNKQ